MNKDGFQTLTKVQIDAMTERGRKAEEEPVRSGRYQNMARSQADVAPLLAEVQAWHSWLVEVNDEQRPWPRSSASWSHLTKCQRELEECRNERSRERHVLQNKLKELQDEEQRLLTIIATAEKEHQQTEAKLGTAEVLLKDKCSCSSPPAYGEIGEEDCDVHGRSKTDLMRERDNLRTVAIAQSKELARLKSSSVQAVSEGARGAVVGALVPGENADDHHMFCGDIEGLCWCGRPWGSRMHYYDNGSPLSSYDLPENKFATARAAESSEVARHRYVGPPRGDCMVVGCGDAESSKVHAVSSAADSAPWWNLPHPASVPKVRDSKAYESKDGVAAHHFVEFGNEGVDVCAICGAPKYADDTEEELHPNHLEPWEGTRTEW